ncbi:hypothetical protein RQP46_007966 [Phenoliferia psychrophenolica]
MTSLSVTSTIKPPTASSPPPSLASTSTQTYALNSTTPAEHLQSLEVALGQARDDLNVHLTEWKVAVGQFEVVTKSKKGKNADDEDEDEDGEEDDEE